MEIVPPSPPEAPSARPVPDNAVREAPPTPQVIDVRPEVTRVPPAVVSQPLGGSVSLRVLKGLRSVPFPVAFPPDAVHPRCLLQLEFQIPPAVVVIVLSARSSYMPSTPVTGALVFYTTPTKTQPPNVVLLSHWTRSVIRFDLEEDIREISALGEVLRQLSSDRKIRSLFVSNFSASESAFERSQRGAHLYGVMYPVSTPPRGPSTFINVSFGRRKNFIRCASTSER